MNNDQEINKLRENQLSEKNRFLNRQRLEEAFATFKPHEPLAVTKQRRDRAKGFVDTSPEGNVLIDLIRMNASSNPMEEFVLYEDGYHTPAQKQPHHPSFMLNSPMKQVIGNLLYPDQKGIRPTRNVIEQFLDIVGARK